MFRDVRSTALGVMLSLAGGVLLADDKQDVHSYAKPTEVEVKHVELDLTVDFANRQLVGFADLTVDRKADAKGAPVHLDLRGISIESVEAGVDSGSLKPVPVIVTTPQPVLGTKLEVRAADGDKLIRVKYRTSPNASALQWLGPELTAGKKAPFLFTQSQAIHARSWIPLQDSPGVRVTYGATIRVPNGLTAVMSAESVPSNEKGVFRFRMKQPIPPYLIALAVGDLAFKAMGKRTGVWAEPVTLEAAAHEFAETEKMVESVEKRFGPYRWERYDILVLPPSFPFGGMENPRLTFATPTVIAKDRSLVSLIAHELAHSWSGNLVTNATWADFWLNEGFTTYLEQRIVEDIYGKPRADIERVLGLKDLRDEIASLPPKDQILHIDLSGRDPDDGVTRIPYDKGALFLSTLEELFGREAFDAFLLGYFNRHAFHSIVTADFLADLKRELLEKNPEAAARIDVTEWIEKPGLPARFARPSAPALATIDARTAEWLAGKIEPAGLGADAWSTQEWLHFLQGLPADLGKRRMAALDAAFDITKGENAEIATQWLLLAIKHGYAEADGRLEAHLVGIGRRKLIVPLYKELMKTDTGKARARRIYAKARPGYHPIAVGTLDDIVGKP